MIVTLLVSVALVAISVIIHYESLLRIFSFMTARPAQLRFILVIGILGTLMAHIVEICIFAIGYYVLIEIGQFERLIGNDMYYIGDYIYYSFVTYTTLGFGDLVPMGPIRFLTGMEALSGLVLIAWTASFLYIQMEKLLARKDLP